MKKRIFAASMASVMALSSVSVVAFADETKDFGETVTKAELKEFLKTYDNLIKGDINNYGSVQALRFQEAYDHAAYVAADADATETDIVAAYQMVTAVAAKLQQYTNAQLKELVDDCKPTYEENNILNDEIMDYIYDEDAFLTFKSAYEDAESLVEVDDLMIVTDAYIALDEAYKALEGKKKTAVLKTEYRAVIKEYEAMLKQFGKYETWRRGTVSVAPTTGGTKKNDKNDLTKASYVTWGQLQEIVNGTSVSTVVTKVNPVASKAAMDDTLASLTTGNTWIAVGDTKNTVEELIYAKSKEFDDYKAASKTTDDTIKGAYDAAVEAIKVFKSWKPIDADSTVKAEAVKTLNKYRSKLANDFENTLITSLEVKSGTDGLFFDDAKGTATSALKRDGDKLVGQPGAGKAGCYLRIDSGTNLIQLDDSGAYNPAEDKTKKSYTIKIAEGVDYMKYIPVRSTNVAVAAGAGISTDSTTAPAKVAKVQAAIALLEKAEAEAAKTKSADWGSVYGKNDKNATKDIVNDIADLDENTTITQPAGSAREYTFINRYLTYALQDLYPEQTAPCSHKRTDVEAIVEKAYDLINKTGEANIFADANANLAAARKDAVEWLRESYKNKKYKDNVANEVDGSGAVTAVIGQYPLGASATLSDATCVYHTLSHDAAGAYDVLDNMLKKYPISYAEIAEKIADVSVGLENGDYNDAVEAALDKVSYALSVLKVTLDGNEAFTDERAFNGYNRLYVADDATTAEKNLKSALDELDKAVEDAGKTEVTKGDVDGDGNVNAFDALAILKYASQIVTLTDAQKAAADVDGDGNVNANDALALLKTLSQG